MDHEPPSAGRLGGPLEIAIMAGVLLIAVAALAWQQIGAGQAASAPTATAEPWPTVAPTFTPQPTPTVAPSPTARPAPTPIVISQRAVAELALLDLRVSAVQVLRGEDARLGGITLPGTAEQITVEYVARVKVGIPYDKVTFVADGASVRVGLPPIEILSIEPDWGASRVLDTEQRLIASDTSELQRRAWASAQEEIRARVLRDTGLLATARRYAAYVIEENLRKLGFTTVVVG